FMPERSRSDERRASQATDVHVRQDQGDGGGGPAPDPQATAQDPSGISRDRGGGDGALGRGGAGVPRQEAAAAGRNPPGSGPAPPQRPRPVTRGTRAEPPMRPLTEREIEILRLIAKGLSNNEAARVLTLSRATVRTHLEHIYEKLEVTNRVEAVTEGLRKGLIEM